MEKGEPPTGSVTPGRRRGRAPRTPTISGVDYSGATPESRALTHVFIPIVAADQSISALFRETGLDWLGQLIIGCLGASRARADADAVRLRAGLRSLGVNEAALNALRGDLAEAMQLIGMPPERQSEVSICLFGEPKSSASDAKRDRRSGAG